MAAPKQKLKMPLSQVRTLTEVDASSLWQQLRGSISQIFAENSSQLSFEVLHRCALFWRVLNVIVLNYEV